MHIVSKLFLMVGKELIIDYKNLTTVLYSSTIVHGTLHVMSILPCLTQTQVCTQPHCDQQRDFLEVHLISLVSISCGDCPYCASASTSPQLQTEIHQIHRRLESQMMPGYPSQ